jgi:hypothetical protein
VDDTTNMGRRAVLEQQHGRLRLSCQGDAAEAVRHLDMTGTAARSNSVYIGRNVALSSCDDEHR